MAKLSKYEKETIINWNEGESQASIYTFHPSLKRRLAEFSEKYPQLCSRQGPAFPVLSTRRLVVPSARNML